MVYSSPHGCIYNIDVSILLIIQNRLKLSRFRRWINAKRSLIMYCNSKHKMHGAIQIYGKAFAQTRVVTKLLVFFKNELLF